jgi:DNA mismatch endonuclease, patch repair protein
MTDSLTPEQRRYTMSRVRHADTKPELVVRSALHRMGYRFTLHRRDLPGKPDIVLPRHRAVIFVHGCFWHRHASCERASMPKTNPAYWRAKFHRNVERDERVRARLIQEGWKVIVVWECEIAKCFHETMVRVRVELGGDDFDYALPSVREVLKVAEARVRYPR